VADRPDPARPFAIFEQGIIALGCNELSPGIG
jgi:hypothetical protein